MTAANTWTALGAAPRRPQGTLCTGVSTCGRGCKDPNPQPTLAIWEVL